MIKINIQNTKIILLLVIVGLLFGKIARTPKTTSKNTPQSQQPQPQPTTQALPPNTVPKNNNPILQKMSQQKIIYTKHAKCRMECRYITEAEIMEILQTGTINNRKSEPNAQPCPTYAVEGFTHQKQEVRIVFANCPTETKVITAIDIGEDHPCGKCD